MKKIIAILTFLFSGSLLQAQQQTIDVKSGDDLTEVTPKEMQYIFDDFTNGTVSFKDGTSGSGKLNYNTLLEEMQFIEQGTNNILALANLENIVSVTIAGRQFIPNRVRREFVEVLISENVGLAIKYKGSAISLGKEGAYGSIGTTSAMTSYSSVTSDQSTTNLSVKEKVAVKLSSTCYLVKGGKFTTIKGAKTFLAAYPKDKAESISKYIHDNNVNFKSKESLIRLTEYCNGL